jgi:hypothetical protein
MRRPDRTEYDRKETEKFKQLQRFTSKCRQLWPDSKIIIRASDSVSINLKEPRS